MRDTDTLFTPSSARRASCRTKAVILVGHGSLRAGSGAAMIRLAARAQAAGVAPIVAAGFLNYSRPTFAEMLARVVARGAGEIVVQPYFLVPGKFVSEDVAQLVAAARADHPVCTFSLAAPFNDHPAMLDLVLKRASEATANRKPRTANHMTTEQPGSGFAVRGSALLIIAHGSPDAAANAPIHRIAARIGAMQCYEAVAVSFLGLNAPALPAAIDALIARGSARIIAVPYFLQFGGHAAEDVPLLLDAARARHPAATILRAEHLGYDPLLVQVIADRVAQLA